MMGKASKSKFKPKTIPTIKEKSKHGQPKKTKDLSTYTISIPKNGTLFQS
jgi:hypothetical protein